MWQPFAALLRPHRWSVDAVGHFVQAASVAEVVVVAVTTPQRRRHGAAVCALAALQQRRVVYKCKFHINHNMN